MMKYCIIAIALGLGLRLHAQFPDNSNHWRLQWSDEFNFNAGGGASKAAQIDYLNTHWNTTIKSDNDGNHYMHVTDGPNVEVSDGMLKLSVTKRNTPIVHYKNGTRFERWYDTDWLVTHHNVWQDNEMNYGYYEMRFKLPDGGLVNGKPKADGIQFAWWMFHGAQSVPGKPPVDWAELDLIEYSGGQDRFTHNYLFKYENEGYPGSFPERYQNEINFRRIEKTVVGSPSPVEYADFRTQTDPLTLADSDGFHTMSCEVTPQKITWYMDGKYLQSTVGDIDVEATLKDIPYWYMEIFCVSPEGFDPDKDEHTLDIIKNHTVLPYTVQMDYIRYHKFNCLDFVAVDESHGQHPNTDVSNHVYSSIRLGEGIGGTPRVKSGDHVVLRAKEYVELLPGFEVALGGEFYADAHECGL